jgi:hypothetical protein
MCGKPKVMHGADVEVADFRPVVGNGRADVAGT